MRLQGFTSAVTVAPEQRTHDAVVGKAETTEVVAVAVEEMQTTAETGGASSLATIVVSKGTSLETISCLGEEHMKRKAVVVVRKTMDPYPA